jgi:tetratricopeptide (TPR) repeat protein
MKTLTSFLLIVGLVGCEGGAGSLDQADQLKAEAEVKKGFHANNELKDHDTAILHFTEAIKIAQQLESDAPGWSYPILADAHTGLGLVYKTKGDDDKALTEYNEAIALCHVTNRYGDLGIAHLGRAGVYALKARKASTAEERARFESLADQEYISSQASFKTDQEYRRRQSLLN